MIVMLKEDQSPEHPEFYKKQCKFKPLMLSCNVQ